MRVSFRGWARDHGRSIVVDEELHEINVQRSVEEYPSNEPTLERVTNIHRITTGISFVRMINVTMNGNYMMRIDLTVSDIAFLAWSAFKEKTLGRLIALWGRFEAAENTDRTE